MAEAQRFDVVIAGGGMTGGMLAAALAERGALSVCVLERERPEPFEPGSSPEYDIRVSALSIATKRLFENVGAWEAVRSRRLCPYRHMMVWDGEAGEGEARHRSPRTRFDATAIEAEALGYIVENRVVQLALLERLERADKVTLRCPERLASFRRAGADAAPGPASGATPGSASGTAPSAASGTVPPVEVVLESGERLETRVLVGADGAGSAVRRLAGIAHERSAYDQHALVATIETELPQQDITWQRFVPSGPQAFLPLAGHRASMVWYHEAEEIARLNALDDEAFAREMEAAFPAELGGIRSVVERASFPIAKAHAAGYVAERVALIGDAAHTVHPLAGQGVNLGMLDAAALAEVLWEADAAGRDIGSQRTLRRYERWRRGENAAMIAALDGFHHVFGPQPLPVRALRRLAPRRRRADRPDQAHADASGDGGRGGSADPPRGNRSRARSADDVERRGCRVDGAGSVRHRGRCRPTRGRAASETSCRRRVERCRACPSRLPVGNEALAQAHRTVDGEAEPLVEGEGGGVLLAHLQVDLRASAGEQPRLERLHQPARVAAAAVGGIDGKIVHPAAVPFVAAHRGGDQPPPAAEAELADEEEPVVDRAATLDVAVRVVPRPGQAAVAPQPDHRFLVVRLEGSDRQRLAVCRRSRFLGTHPVRSPVRCRVDLPGGRIEARAPGPSRDRAACRFAGRRASRSRHFTTRDSSVHAGGRLPQGADHRSEVSIAERRFGRERVTGASSRAGERVRREGTGEGKTMNGEEVMMNGPTRTAIEPRSAGAPSPHWEYAASGPRRRARGVPALAAATLLAASLGLSGGCTVFETLGVDPLGPQPLAGAAQSAVRGQGNVRVHLESDGTAIVEGWVDDMISEQAVLREVARYPGVTGVVDNLLVEDWYR